MKLDPQHSTFTRTIYMFYGSEFLQNDPKIAKIENFQVFFNFWPFFVQFLSYYLALKGLKAQQGPILVSNRQF